MPNYKISKLKRKESLARAGAIGAALVVSPIISFHCKDKRDEIVCINNEVEEPLDQGQTRTETDPALVFIDGSIVTVSGNVSVSPSVSPSPSPSSPPPPIS